MSKNPQQQAFANRLLKWWDQHGRKDLPWQQLGSTYGFWIAEVMLQQTQVTTVIPYFQKFMQRFTDLPRLAAAHQDEVLAHWSGLGYYSRARNLHKAANVCMQDHAGKLPDDPEQLQNLPGIGRSTANAIISQSSDRVLSILDGNVKRVLARHAGIPGWPGQSKVAKALWQVAEQRLPSTRGADYTQAGMDLGALLCTRTKPRCVDCPVSGDCHALMNNKITELPGKKPKKDKQQHCIDMLVVQDVDGKILLHRRPPAGIWGSLWSLPEARSGQTPANDPSAKKIATIQHELTHRTLLITPWLVTSVPDNEVAETDQHHWFTAQQALSLGLPQPVRKLIEKLYD